jgi:hypothetical protein
MIRRGDEFRVGPIRISILSNDNGHCSVLPIYGTYGSLGTVGTIDEEVLDQLAEEEGVIVHRATRKSQK